MFVVPGVRKIVWFSKSVSFYDSFGLVEYRQASENCKKSLLFKSDTFYTKIINLKSVDESFLTSLPKKTRYEINRAEKEGVFFAKEINLADFVEYYNQFAQAKSLASIDIGRLEKIKPENLLITKGGHESIDSPLVMHAYLVDGERARLLYSCSHYRTEPELKKLVGMSNRFLHFKDILFFKDAGYAYYDLGGYAYETDNYSLQAINKFKDEFGGKLVKEYNLMSWPNYCVKKLFLMLNSAS